MQKNRTLADIDNLMGRIGCYNQAQMDYKMHSNYINESLEDEAYKKGSHDDIWKNKKQDADENTKVEITDSYAILYNASKADAIDSLLDKGANIEYIGSSAGTFVWGRGIYTNFQRYQAHWRSVEDKGLYGAILVKYKYHGNLLEECLVSEPQLWKEPLSQQVKKFKGLAEFLKSRRVNLDSLDNASKGSVSSGGMDIIRSACGGWQTMANVLLSFGVQGVVFFGHNDRPVAVIYDADKLEILDYVDNTKVHELNKDLEWKGLKQGQGGRTAGNDVNPILAYFKNFQGNMAYTRPQCGEILLMDKNTGKHTFLDYAKAKDIIAKRSEEDPRLFGEFEFENAQNFVKMNGKELAFVQLDKNPESRFYIDKGGNLYRRPSQEPFSNINSYYGNTDEPMYNKIENADDVFNFSDNDDDDFNNFKNLFSESIMRIIQEQLEDESRTETQDGYVELDNFDLARKIMKFNGDDLAYFIKIAERHKDHPDRHYEHDACAYKGFFEIVSIEHLNAVEPVIKNLCKRGEWRAMMYINPRPMTATRDFAHSVLEPRFKRHNSHLQGHEIEVAYGQSKDWPDRPLCFVDVDNDDPQIHKQVLDYINKMGIKPLDTYNTTNNGLHIILPDKEAARKLDFSFLDKGKNLGKWATAGLEIDKAFTLYAYVKAKGYGTQQRMQQRIGQITK